MNEIISICEDYIRSGRVDLAQGRLRTAKINELSRSQALPFANLCRRVGLVNLGLRALSPIVRAEKKNLLQLPSPKELAEYAVLLQRNDATEESIRLLKEIETARAPEALLYRAFAHFTAWDSAEAAEVLSKYLEFDLSPYARLVGQVNLAAALVSSQQTEIALEVIEKNIRIAQGEKFVRLQANLLELRAQLSIQRREFSSARSDLEEAVRVMGENGLSDHFFIEKWNAVIEGLATQKIEPLLNFKKSAVQKEHWETIREIDRFILQIEFESFRFQHLVYGTPHQAYRRAVQAEHPAQEVGSVFLFGTAGAPSLDLVRGQFSGCEEQPTVSLHRIVEATLSDLYKPIALGGLFAKLFPGENFDIFSSGNRVYQLIYRMRRWLTEKGLPLQVTESKGRYLLEMTEPFCIMIPFERARIGADDRRLKALFDHFGARSFTRDEASRALGLSSTSCKRLLSWAVAAKHLERGGAAASTRYWKRPL